MTKIDSVAAALHTSLDRLANGVGAEAPAASAETFRALMARPSMAPPVVSSDGLEAAANIVSAQDAALQAGVMDSVEFMRQAPTMNLNELNAGAIRLTFELAVMQFNMEAKMSVVHASKSAVETLMKNQ